MPELPEVQTVVETLSQAGIIGRRIEKAEVNWPKTIYGRTPSSFCKNSIFLDLLNFIPQNFLSSMKNTGQIVLFFE